MKISEITVHVIRVPLERTFWMSLEPYTEASEILVEVHTGEGVRGVGEIHGRPLGQIVRILQEGLGPLLKGRNPLEIESIYHDLFSCTHTRKGAKFSQASGQPHFGGGVRPQFMAAIAGIDIALWDLKGKILNLPVFRLLGGHSTTVPVYASGGYYGSEGQAAIDELLAEMTSYVEAGYSTVKMKVGGLSLSEDVARVKAVREAVGPDVGILLDANQGYDVPAAIAAARAFEPFEIGWFEEPVHWYDSIFGLARVARSTTVSIASGESELHRWGCRDLIEHGGIHVMQFDCTRAGGVSEWLKVAAHAAAHGVGMAPHHDPQIHGHLLAAVNNGLILEAFPNRERDPLWQELFVERPEIRDGVLHLSERPGFGLKISEEALREYSSQP